MESWPLSTMPALRKLGSSFSFWRSRSNGAPQDRAGNSRSPASDYEKCKIEMMKKPHIRRIFDIMELDMLLLNLINLNTCMLKTKSNQYQLKQLVELIKLNVNLLIHEPFLLHSIKLDLGTLDVLLATSHTTDQASTQHDDPLKNIKDIYEKLEEGKAKVGQVEFDENLIEDTRKRIFQAERQLEMIKVLYDQLENARATTGQVDQFDDIRKLIQPYHEEFQAEHQPAPSGSSIDPNRLNNDVAKHIANLLPVELRPASAKSNLNQVKRNLELLKGELDGNQIELKDELINVTSNLIYQISRIPNLQANSNWEEIMESQAVGIIQLMCSPKAKIYIGRMDSFKDICNKVAAMYKHSLHGGRTDENYTWCGSFHKDIFKGNCEGVEKFLKENPFALTAKITADGNTALHIAVKAMRQKIVRRLLEKLKQENRLTETLKMGNEEKKTALYIAASSGGDPIIAKELVNTNKDMLLIEWYNDETVPIFLFPLFVAAKYNHKKMVKYLYGEMQQYKGEKERMTGQKVEFLPNKKWVRQWASFLADLIYNEDYDMALRVIKDYPSLALSKYTDVETPLFALAQRPSLGANVTFNVKASKFQCRTFICGNKMNDGTASKASELLENIILTIEDLESQKPALKAAFFKAAEVGSDKFVAIFINSLPLVLSWLNDLHQNIFHVAIINRQENIFNLIYGMGSVKNDLTGSADKLNNWMLHLAGVIAPPNRLNQLPGPATQLQRELQWFEAVRDIVPNLSIDAKNLSVDGKTTPEFSNRTPSELFTSTHIVLMKDAQNWMRNTASQCSVVAALITTVMFAVAFTLPGGNDQNTGDPMFLGDTSFLLFAAADFVALLTSCTSVLIFLAILTSRFSQDDFLKSLPMRLFRGLLFLFVAMAAMIFAFCDTIYIVIRKRYNWIYIPTIFVGSIPVVIFWSMMRPLLFDLRRATKNSIFDKSTRTRVLLGSCMPCYMKQHFGCVWNT